MRVLGVNASLAGRERENAFESYRSSQQAMAVIPNPIGNNGKPDKWASVCGELLSIAATPSKIAV